MSKKINNNDKKFLNEVCQVLKTQSLGILATQTEEYPYLTLVSFVSSNDIKTIIFATLKESRKYENIQENKKVSIFIGSQKNIIEDYKDAKALSFYGIIKKTTKKQSSEYKKLYLKKHPHFAEFLSDPQCKLMVISVKKITLSMRFQEVREYLVP